MIAMILGVIHVGRALDSFLTLFICLLVIIVMKVRALWLGAFLTIAAYSFGKRGRISAKPEGQLSITGGTTKEGKPLFKGIRLQGSLSAIMMFIGGTICVVDLAKYGPEAYAEASQETHEDASSDKFTSGERAIMRSLDEDLHKQMRQGVSTWDSFSFSKSDLAIIAEYGKASHLERATLLQDVKEKAQASKHILSDNDKDATNDQHWRRLSRRLEMMSVK